MYEDGVYVKKEPKVAFNFYVEGAANNHALCYYHLASMYKDGKSIPKDPYLHFKYLKRAAEEGFINAQHLLGVAYFEGKYTEKDDKLALAWFREAARNGYPISLINAGDLLMHGSELGQKIDIDKKAAGDYSPTPEATKSKTTLKPNLLFALSQYISAYKFGAHFLEERIQIIIKHLRQTGDFRKE